jgi:hemolysin III
VGLVLSLVGLPFLLALAILRGNAWHVAGCAVFGASLVILYTASTLYHSLRTPRWKRIFQVADHSCIYLLIAGTYTPFTLGLRGGWGWLLFGMIWTLSVIGITLKVFFADTFKLVCIALYPVMGWLAVIAFKPLFLFVHTGGVVLLLCGGLAYTFGMVFFASTRIRFNHAIWHVFVLIGSVCHYFAVMFYVLPARG